MQAAPSTVEAVMADGGSIEIDDLVEVPGQDEPLSVLVPMLEGDWAGEPGQVEVGADVEVMPALAEQLTEELGVGADDLRRALSQGYKPPSSLVRVADQWKVTDIAQAPEGQTRVTFGRRGLHEMGIRLASGALERCEVRRHHHGDRLAMGGRRSSKVREGQG